MNPKGDMYVANMRSCWALYSPSEVGDPSPVVDNLHFDENVRDTQEDVDNIHELCVRQRGESVDYIDHRHVHTRNRRNGYCITSGVT